MKKNMLLELFLTFLKIGAFTFGGGYAMIALIAKEAVEKRKWITEPEFIDLIAIAESTPGPIAVNSATYLGYKLKGFFGLSLRRWG
ncbi:MAG: chromate transporter [Candidatus Izemoplasmatales bacterium]|jgi:chromate transporter